MKYIIEKIFSKNYHPTLTTYFILDPLYLFRDSSGKYLPPFNCLTVEQEKDVSNILTRAIFILVFRDKAHIALMELMKWCLMGLYPLYAQEIKVKQPNLSLVKLKSPIVKVVYLCGKHGYVSLKYLERLLHTWLHKFKVLGKVVI